jgi:hypothetical protein
MSHPHTTLHFVQHCVDAFSGLRTPMSRRQQPSDTCWSPGSYSHRCLWSCTLARHQKSVQEYHQMSLSLGAKGDDTNGSNDVRRNTWARPRRYTFRYRRFLYMIPGVHSALPGRSTAMRDNALSPALIGLHLCHRLSALRWELIDTSKCDLKLKFRLVGLRESELPSAW